MAQQWHEVGTNPQLIISCDAGVTVRGHTESSLVLVSTAIPTATVKNGVIESKDPLKLLVPKNASLIIKKIGGELRAKGISGSIVANTDIPANASLFNIGSDVYLQRVDGDLRARDLSAKLEVDSVGADVRIRRSAETIIHSAAGDLVIEKSTGSVTLTKVAGDVALAGIVGDVQINAVAGDCALMELSGNLSISGEDDIRIQGPLTVGTHTIQAKSAITIHWPDKTPFQVEATAPTILNRYPFAQVTQENNQFVGTLGSSAVRLSLTAGERITIKVDHADDKKSSKKSEHTDFEFDLAGIGDRIISEFNDKISGFAQVLPPELSKQAEQAIRRAQVAVEKAIEQLENASPTTPPTPQEEREPIVEMETEDEVIFEEDVVTEAEISENREAVTEKSAEVKNTVRNQDIARIKILEMVKQGILTPEEGIRMLSALE